MSILDRVIIYLIIIFAIGVTLIGVSALGQEVLIYLPDGTAQYCITYDNGETWYCR